MESKVTLYNVNGEEIGETYSRRARQLVKQQRAMWADDTHTSIQFLPDATEDWEAAIDEEAPKTTPHTHDHKPNTLYTLAEKRLRARRRFIWHCVLLIPVYMLVTGLSGVMYNVDHEIGMFFLGLGMGAWTVLFACHVFMYIKTHGRGVDWEMRRKLKLDAEVAALKRMGYVE